jgi:hypothetical protein
MLKIFVDSSFSYDLSNWKPYNVSEKMESINCAFANSNSPIPYWANYEDKDERTMAIKAYHLKNGIVKQLNEELITHKNKEPIKKIKI